MILRAAQARGMTAERMFDPLPASFYKPSAAAVAPRLLGHFLLRRTERGLLGGEIVETEAYLRDDPACHGFRRKTARNRTMFGPPGRAYVYFIYGNHYCVNAVCCAPGVAEAVLIRAIQATVGLERMQENRAAHTARELTNGPGKLCEALGIGRELDGVGLCSVASPLFIARNPERRKFLMERGPRVIKTRVGIREAAHLPLRFYLERSEFVSRR
jgi:DNA-3-methyladenine glycosylase